LPLALLAARSLLVPPISTANLNSFSRFSLRNHHAIVCALSGSASAAAKSRWLRGAYKYNYCQRNK
jgi:hypothetical protein